MGMTAEQQAERPVKFRNLLAYGVGDLYGGGSFIVIGTLFMYFMTELVGLNPFLAGLVFGIGKIWDGISDPMMGYISDRTHTRFGRRRVYFLLGIIPILLSFLIMWVDIGAESDLVLFLYYSFAYIFFSTVFTMVLVPYSALNAEMTTDYKVRSRLSAARMMFSQGSILMAGVLPRMIIDAVGKGTSQGYLVMGLFFGVIYGLIWIPVFLGTWELPFKRVMDRSRPLDIFKQFGNIFRNKSFRVHIIMYICAYSVVDILMALFMYYLTYHFGREGMYSAVMGVLLVAQLGMLPVYVYIGNKKGKGTAFIVGSVLWLIGILTYVSLPADASLALLLVASALVGGGQSAGVLIPWAILPSVTDVDQLMSGKKRAGSYSGAMTLVRKLVQGLIAMPLVGFFLGIFGFGKDAAALADPNVFGLRMIFLTAPAVFLLLGILVALRFKITPKTHETMMGEIRRLRTGGDPADVDPETRSTCEILTGFPYENLELVKQAAAGELRNPQPTDS